MLESLYNRYDQILQQKEKINEAVSLLLFGANVDAVIYVGMFDRNISGIFGEIRKPLVIAYSTSDDEQACFVTYDNENISKEAVNALFELGHRQVAVITGLAHTYPARLRMRGVEAAFMEAGLMLPYSMVKNGDWEYESGISCMAELLSQDTKPTAVFAMNDLMAAGAMDAIKAVGLRIPEDISVIGFDNRDFTSYLTPRLSTVEIDLKEIGRMAAKITLDKINSVQNIQRDMVIPCRLVMRDTVAKYG
jgi:LacI family transcriptional regulator